ncbi:DUF3558 domain-containing protein [Saccharopolyspora sp. NPDC050389]|uniref:DUF3558 domain-containing protein n=1 Tax=Saccharopolyspora sp. NPDC050389 TaxID=3155516 RepID=UPI0033C126DE
MIALVAAAVALTGCTVNGPDPDSEPTSTSAPTTKNSSLDLPKRPQDLAIAGKQDAEICTWLKSEQKPSLQIGGSGRPVQKDGNNYNGCAFLGEDGKAQFGLALRVVPEGIQSFVQKVNSSPESGKTYEINGFGAVQGQLAGGESLGCDVFVDAAERQTLWINMMLQTPGGMDNQQMCERAKQAAEAAVTTLQGS